MGGDGILYAIWGVSALLILAAALLPKPEMAPKLSFVALAVSVGAFFLPMSTAFTRLGDWAEAVGIFVAFVSGVPTMWLAAAMLVVALVRKSRANGREALDEGTPRCLRFGKEVSDGAIFCPHCRRALEEDGNASDDGEGEESGGGEEA